MRCRGSRVERWGREERERECGRKQEGEEDNAERRERERGRLREGGAVINNLWADIKGKAAHGWRGLNMLLRLCKGLYQEISNMKGQNRKTHHVRVQTAAKRAI